MVDSWRCALCGAINTFEQKEPDVCSNCKYDYMSDVDTPIVTNHITMHHNDTFDEPKKSRKKDLADYF